ncbi:hypothetical protein PPERSA_03728 [Pseudocohnilembus persalinus]|uniref:Uncharacterized protein n=1 Tax=Pseudocohnilembus persalinus TaxID=266149 RepID=A0A0V0QHJ4_PSEPJ|nr:hypothetical protein PPERSA_03728 [Pseudocohnilembus persalinus]|eukprot:KRX01644.1 hypothetical protein PPERSA_03728 [Pseudocohnilembus persalinus]
MNTQSYQNQNNTQAQQNYQQYQQQSGIQNNTQVETTAIVELFSTFFDKITSQHPEKDEMMKDLQQLKGQIYQNQNDLDKVQGFLQNLKESKNSLNKNQNKFSNGNIKTESDKNSRNSNYSQNFNQNQNQINITDNFGNQGFTFNRNFLKQNRNKVFKIGEFVDYKYQNQSNKEQIKEQLIKKGVKYLREFQTETLSGYRGLFFGYVENLIKGDQKEKVFEIINDVKNGRIQMKKSGFNENNNNYLTKNQDIERNISDKFVGYMQFIFDQMSRIQQQRKSEYNNINNIQNQRQSLTIQNLVDDFYQMVNCDAEFDKGGVIYLKEILIKCINKSQNNGYQRQNLECLLSENQDINEEILQLASQTLQMNVFLHNQIGKSEFFQYQNQQSLQKQLQLQQNQIQRINQIHLMKSSNGIYQTFYLVYMDEKWDNQQIQQLQNDEIDVSQIENQQITDLINQAEFVKEMLLIFEENNQTLKEKMEFMDEFDDEEEIKQTHKDYIF